jgi:hypothetical protein
MQFLLKFISKEKCKTGVVMHTCHPGTQEAGGSQVQGQPGSCLKKKKKNCTLITTRNKKKQVVIK